MHFTHGGYNISVKADVIVVSLNGVLEEVIARFLTKELKQKVEDFSEKPFFIIINDVESEGVTPDAYKVIDGFNHWLNGQNMLGKAIISESPVQPSVDMMYLQSLQQQNISIFSNMQDAELWIQKLRADSKTR